MKSKPTLRAQPAVLLDEACLPVLVVVTALGRLRFGGLGPCSGTRRSRPTASPGSRRRPASRRSSPCPGCAGVHRAPGRSRPCRPDRCRPARVRRAGSLVESRSGPVTAHQDITGGLVAIGERAPTRPPSWLTPTRRLANSTPTPCWMAFSRSTRSSAPRLMSRSSSGLRPSRLPWWFTNSMSVVGVLAASTSRPIPSASNTARPFGTRLRKAPASSRGPGWPSKIVASTPARRRNRPSTRTGDASPDDHGPSGLRGSWQAG